MKASDKPLKGPNKAYVLDPMASWLCIVVVDADLLTHWGRDKMSIFRRDFLSIFENENVAPGGCIYNIPALDQIMAWHRPGNKPLSEPMMVRFTDALMFHSASMD